MTAPFWSASSVFCGWAALPSQPHALSHLILPQLFQLFHLNAAGSTAPFSTEQMYSIVSSVNDQNFGSKSVT